MIQGDLNVRRTGAIDGWCWDTDRPAARLAVELLVDGALVATVAADAARRDLQRRGIGDGRHAFNASIGAATLAGAERLVAARDSQSRVVFGQYFVGVPGLPDPDPALDALDDGLRQLMDGLGRLMALRRDAPDPSRALHEEFGRLATVLAAPGIHSLNPAARQVAVVRAVLAQTLGPTHRVTRAPSVSLVPLNAGLSGALAWAARVGAADGGHELLVPDPLVSDPGAGSPLALLPSLLAGLRVLSIAGAGLAATLAVASAKARGAVVAVVGARPASLVAFDDAVARLAGSPPGILLGAAPSLRARSLGLGRDWDECHAAAATGLLFATSPCALAGDLDPAFDGDPALAVLDLALRHPGRCLTLTEPWQPPDGMVPDPVDPEARDRFRIRWSA